MKKTPVPGMPIVRRTPRRPMVTCAPRRPNEVLRPRLDRLMVTPGATRNRRHTRVCHPTTLRLPAVATGALIGGAGSLDGSATGHQGGREGRLCRASPSTHRLSDQGDMGDGSGKPTSGPYKRPTMLARDKTVLDTWIVPMFGARRIASLTPHDIKQFVKAMELGAKPRSQL